MCAFCAQFPGYTSDNLSDKGIHEVNARRFVLVSADHPLVTAISENAEKLQMVSRSRSTTSSIETLPRISSHSAMGSLPVPAHRLHALLAAHFALALADIMTCRARCGSSSGGDFYDAVRFASAFCLACSLSRFSLTSICSLSFPTSPSSLASRFASHVAVRLVLALGAFCFFYDGLVILYTMPMFAEKDLSRYLRVCSSHSSSLSSSNNPHIAPFLFDIVVARVRRFV